LNSPRYSLPSGKVIDPVPFGLPFSIFPIYFPSLSASPFSIYFGSPFSILKNRISLSLFLDI
jgi:hypothetical protein